MIKRFGYLLLVLLVGVISLFLFLHRGKNYSDDPSRTVYIKKDKGSFELIRNGIPFYIKGASGKSYIKELAEAGGNTLRLYDTINLQNILDKAQLYDIAVIVDIPLPRFNNYVNFYSDEVFKKNTILKVKSLVNKHKNHPALLFWNLGNELTYSLPTNKERKSFINFFNVLIDLIHEEDVNHPVGTTVAGPSLKETFKINQYSPQIDLIGHNAFSRIKKVKSNERIISYLSSSVPYYISEWGIKGPWEQQKNKWMAILEQSSTEKGERYKAIYNSYIKADSHCLGSLAFYWGNKVEGTPTWFNIFDKKGRKSQAYYSLKEAWSDTINGEISPPQIVEMKLDDKTDDNLVFNTGEIIEAEISIKNMTHNKLDYKWMLYENGWGKKGWKLNEELNKFTVINQNLTESRAQVTMPQKEGAYRLFVHVYDENNNFATANIPFYILDPE